MKKINLSTERSGLFDITGQIENAILEDGIEEGFAVIWIPHSTAGITVISKMDPLGFEDIEDEIMRLIPTRVDFKHQFDTPTDAAGHIKSALMGVTLTVIIWEGKIQIGSSQGIYFFEFDGPRKRQIYIQTGGRI